MALTSRATVKTLLGITDTSVDDILDICVSAAISAVKSYLRGGAVAHAFTSWPETGSDSQYWSGNNHHSWPLEFTPVTAIASIYFDPDGFFGDGPATAFPSDTLLTAGTDYVLKKDASTSISTSGLVVRLGGRGSTATGSMFGEDSSWFPFSMFTPATLSPGSLAASGRRPAVWGAYPGGYKITYTAGYTSLPADLGHAATLFAVQLYRNREVAGYTISTEGLGAYHYALLSNPGYPEFGTIRQLLAKYRCQSLSF